MSAADVTPEWIEKQRGYAKSGLRLNPAPMLDLLDSWDALRSEVVALRAQLAEWRWIPVGESLPEDRDNVGFIVDCKRDDFYHARVYGGSFHRSDWDNGWGGFNTHGYGARASHWCRLPPVDALRSGEAGKEREA